MYLRACLMLFAVAGCFLRAEENAGKDAVQAAAPKNLTPKELREALDRPVTYKGGSHKLEKFFTQVEQDTGVSVRFKAQDAPQKQSAFSTGGIQQVPLRTVLDLACCMTGLKWACKEGKVELEPAGAGEVPKWPDHPGLLPLGSVGVRTQGPKPAGPDPKVEKALSAVLDAEFNSTPLSKLIETLAQKAGVPIVLQAPEKPWSALPVTTSFKGKTLKQALEWVAETSRKVPGAKGLQWEKAGTQIVFAVVPDAQAGKKNGNLVAPAGPAGPGFGGR